MAKSSRSSVTKTNRSKLKSRVFGPAEDARTKRLSEKLMELASQPKSEQTEMETEQTREPEVVEPEDKETSHAADDTTMDVDTAQSKPSSSSRKTEKRRKEAKKAGIEKKRHRKPRNTITFAKKRTGRPVK